MQGALDELLRHPALWRGRDAARAAAPGEGVPATVATGFAVLDECLPGGGWPLGAITEILHRGHGIGELSLLLPALAALARDGRWLAWIAPPWRIAAPALEARGIDPARLLVVRGCSANEAVWAAEQALRSAACGAVLLWPQAMRGARPGRRGGDGFRQLRRLQLAAETGHGLGVLFGDVRVASNASPAALRLRLSARGGDLQVEVLKSRGGRRISVCLDPRAAAVADPA
jgi:hypothetical protein